MAYEFENKFVQTCITDGNYYFTNHFNLRRSERKIPMNTILDVIIKGKYEAAKDSKQGLPRMKYTYNGTIVIIEINISDGLFFITCYEDQKTKEL